MIEKLGIIFLLLPVSAYCHICNNNCLSLWYSGKTVLCLLVEYLSLVSSAYIC